MTPAMETILGVVGHQADDLGLPWMLVGAIARDLLVAPHLPDVRLRLSLDLDLAVQVADWEGYAQMRDSLIAIADFEQHPSVMHRLVHAQSNIWVDLLPFGGVADEDRNLHWPGEEQSLHVGLYPLVYRASQLGKMGAIEGRLPTVPGFVLLKLCAWRDAPSRSKDVEDIWFLATHYLDLVDDERLYSGSDQDLLNERPFDYRLAGARLLGRDLRSIESTIVPATVCEWLSDVTFYQNLLATVRGMEDHEDDAWIESFWEHIRAGLAETCQT